MTEEHKAREKRIRRFIRYSHGFDEATILELDHQSDLALLRSLDGDIANANGNQRRMLKRQGLIHLVVTSREGAPRLRFTAKGKALLEGLV